MSTEFILPATGILVDTVMFTRKAQPTADGRPGPCFEFGTVENFILVRQLLDLGMTFIPLGSEMVCDPTTVVELNQLLVNGHILFSSEDIGRHAPNINLPLSRRA